MKELDEMGKINSKLSAAVEEVTLEHREKREVSLNLLILIPLSRTKMSVSYWIENLNKLSSFKYLLLQIVKHHSKDVELQRRVFMDFFCNPERLRSQVRELNALVRARQASS